MLGNVVEHPLVAWNTPTPSVLIVLDDTDSVGWGNYFPCGVLDRILLAIDGDRGRLDWLGLDTTVFGTIERGDLIVLGSARQRIFPGTTRWDRSGWRHLRDVWKVEMYRSELVKL
jgi:hypothetical protein